MKTSQYLIKLSLLVLLSACASQPAEKYSGGGSYLQENEQERLARSEVIPSGEKPKSSTNSDGFTSLKPMGFNEAAIRKTVDYALNFSGEHQVEISSDTLPLTDFLHYILGEVLQSNYILSGKAKEDKRPVTLNIQNAVSKRRLFVLLEELLTEYGYNTRFSEDVFYINNEEETAGNSNIAFGYGQKLSSVPTVNTDIMQLVPFKHGFKGSLGLLLPQITNVQVIPDASQGIVMLKGKRADVIKGLEFIQLIDKPRYRDRQVAMYKTIYADTALLKLKIPELLTNDGFASSLAIVALPQQGMLVMFSNVASVLARAQYWLEKIDQPLEGVEKQYFVFQPRFARATDLNESLAPLIGGSSSSGASTFSSNENSTNKGGIKDNKSSRVKSAHGEDITLVVDERSNVLIVQTTGEKYRRLLPLIRRLDVLPKQVMLEVMIVEVNMTNEFKQGIEFALKNGNYSFSTKGAFMGEGFGGLAYSAIGANAEVLVNLFESNSLINVLSRPSLVVRDGVKASINIGTDIPVVGQTTQDPIAGGSQTTSIQYRKTGVSLEVTPTVNSQGVVSMAINQAISNEIKGGSTVSDSPAIFERTLITEVVADSGQTVILGGLISEDSTTVNSQVPFFSSLPLVGALFKAETEETKKTELVIMVTPRIIESSHQWYDVKSKFEQNLSHISIN